MYQNVFVSSAFTEAEKSLVLGVLEFVPIQRAYLRSIKEVQHQMFSSNYTLSTFKVHGALCYKVYSSR